MTMTRQAKTKGHLLQIFTESFYKFFRRLSRGIKDNIHLNKQSFLALVISSITSVLAGLLLGSLREVLLLLPGLLILVPPALGMRGHIFGTLGSRISTALHLGTADKFTLKSQLIRNNIYATMSLTIIMSIFLGSMAAILASAFGLKNIGFASFVLISFLGGILSGVFLLVLTFAIAFVSYRLGWDPDNVTSPLITAIGDFVTLPSLLVATIIVLQLPSPNIIALLAGLIAVFLIIISLPKDLLSYRSIITQSIFILSIVAIVDILSGILIESNIENLIAIPIVLVILPAFLAQGGNVGNILAARLSTKLHLGTLDVDLKLGHEIKKEFINSYLLALLIFPLIGFLAYTFSSIIGIGGLSLINTITLTLLAGIILTTIVIITTFLVSMISFKYNVDPDNVTIPIITSTADFLGVISLLVVLNLLV